MIETLSHVLFLETPDGSSMTDGVLTESQQVPTTSRSAVIDENITPHTMANGVLEALLSRYRLASP
jgi:hypothetical protein